MIKENARRLLDEVNAYGRALENHCLRIAEFAIALADHQGVDCDPDLIYAGAYLHDIGLLVPDDRSANYLYRGLAFVESHMTAWELDTDQRQQLSDMLLYNHAIGKVKQISPAGDLMRLGVQVEHSLGRCSHGLSKSVRLDIFNRYPRLDFNRVLVDFFKITWQRDGAIEMFRLFYPKKETANAPPR